MNILHLLYTSLPAVGGYAIRTDNILRTLKQFNVENYPLVYETIKKGSPVFRYGGITYNQYSTILRNFLLNKIPNNQSLIKKIIKNLLLIYETIFRIPHKKIREMIKINNIDIIHGYSPYYFSKFGASIKEKSGIPFIYEKRGFSELSNLTEGLYSRKSLIFKWDTFNELNTLRKADRIVTLSSQMKKELIKMGLSSSKIEIIYNCVNINKFTPQTPNKSLIKNLNLENKRIIGYVGHIRRLEGIDYLLKAFFEISNKYRNLILLLVGNISFELKSEYQNLIRELKLENKVIFTGVVPYDKIIDYYSIFDIIIIPRINEKVCNLVTPQKPLEIMAMEKLLLVSDVKGLTEIVKPGVSGDVFKSESVDDLAEMITFYLENEDIKNEIEKKSREYISKNFTCKNQFKKYLKIYQDLV